RVFDGIKLRLINPLEYHQKILLFGEREYEQQMINMLGHVLKPGMVFFDVGANMGYHTLLASRLVGTEGQVHAFEPAPTQFHHLKLNVQINNASNIVINNCAVADSIGEKEFFISEGWNQGIHSLGKLPGREKSCRVSCISIDDYIERNGIKQIDVMKVDVE